MKSEQINLGQSFPSTLYQLNKYLKCSGGNQAINACCRQNCDQTALSCLNKNCDCRKLHKQCFLRLQIQCIHNFFNTKIQEFKKIKQIIQDQIKKTIDQLSLFKENIIKDIDNSLTYFGITDRDKLIMQALRSGQCNQIKGQHIYQFQQNVREDKKCHKKAQNKMAHSWTKIGNQINELKKSVSHIILTQNSLKQSSIIKNIDDNMKINMFFDNKIKYAELIFQASKNQFLASKFHKKCDKIARTLTIVQTNKGKIFGGYNPYEWKSDNTYSYAYEKPFIFQLNNNHKFNLKTRNSEKAIYNYKYNGPNFGQNDFKIADKANINSSSSANIGGYYQNANYIYGDTNSRIKFSGQFNFTVKQYEVWKIQLY